MLLRHFVLPKCQSAIRIASDNFILSCVTSAASKLILTLNASIGRRISIVMRIRNPTALGKTLLIFIYMSVGCLTIYYLCSTMSADVLLKQALTGCYYAQIHGVAIHILLSMYRIRSGL